MVPVRPVMVYMSMRHVVIAVIHRGAAVAVVVVREVPVVAPAKHQEAYRRSQDKYELVHGCFVIKVKN